MVDAIDSPAPSGMEAVGGMQVRPHLGWTRLALALRKGLDEQGSETELLKVDIAGFEPIIIDASGDAFWWPSPLTDLTHSPEDMHISHVTRASESIVSTAPGRDLSELLWRIGLHSFPNELAWWLEREERYRLARWPNYTTLEHTADHVRMTSLLGYAFLSVDELAEQANVAPNDARRLINAFSVMGILRTEAIVTPRPALERIDPSTPVWPNRKPGLFRRLRERMGL